VPAVSYRRRRKRGKKERAGECKGQKDEAKTKQGTYIPVTSHPCRGGEGWEGGRGKVNNAKGQEEGAVWFCGNTVKNPKKPSCRRDRRRRGGEKGSSGTVRCLVC